MSTNITHRITSLERWGMRVHADFQPNSVACIREAGFTGVLVNGGSGIGPDMMPIESLVASPVIPDLMPRTVQGNQREMTRRCDLLKEAGIKPWLCLWGAPGPDESAGAVTADSNRFFDRRSKLEMTAKLRRTPELFGHRHPHELSWRGSRPLCVSHPTVREFYGDLMTRLVDTYADLEGIFFFPGDNGAELCQECCPRCQATGDDQTTILCRYVNDLYASLTAANPDFKFYFTIWNQDQAGDGQTIQHFLDELHPGIGICMSISDNVVQQRKSGPNVFNQPWVTFAQPGRLFQRTVDKAHAQGRATMVLGEISQSEVWDPTCHNMPNPRKVLDLLRNSEKVPGADAICDFWGHRGPFNSSANHAAMRAYYADPEATAETLLSRAASDHYGLKEKQTELLTEALSCWQAFDDAVDNWALNVWGQRFSFAIGRDAARGRLYGALIPAFLRPLHDSWSIRVLRDKGIDLQAFGRFQEEDRSVFLNVASRFAALAAALTNAGLPESAKLAESEARNIELAGELIASIGRTVLAGEAFHDADWQTLRAIIEAEIEARLRQQEISGRIGWAAGVNSILVDEDIQNMRLYLSCDDFPSTPDDVFHVTATPYSV